MLMKWRFALAKIADSPLGWGQPEGPLEVIVGSDDDHVEREDTAVRAGQDISWQGIEDEKIVAWVIECAVLSRQELPALSFKPSSDSLLFGSLPPNERLAGDALIVLAVNG